MSAAGKSARSEALATVVVSADPFFEEGVRFHLAQSEEPADLDFLASIFEECSTGILEHVALELGMREQTQLAANHTVASSMLFGASYLMRMASGLRSQARRSSGGME